MNITETLEYNKDNIKRAEETLNKIYTCGLDIDSLVDNKEIMEDCVTINETYLHNGKIMLDMDFSGYMIMITNKYPEGNKRNRYIRCGKSDLFIAKYVDVALEEEGIIHPFRITHKADKFELLY